MKRKILLIILIVLNAQLINAQENKKNTYYLSSELNLGNYFGVDYNLNYVFKNNYSLKLGFSGNVRKPKSEPEDFSGGLNGLFSVGIKNPYDHLLNYRIDFGKIYNFNPEGTIRLNFSFGIGYTIIKEPDNWQFVESDTVINLAENYTYSYKSYNTLSFTINPKIEFPITKFFGLSVSPMLQMNKDRTYFGIGLGTMLGKLK
ncbi:hypothetical protein [Hwangdonia sp.]|uniref:hypothetical protein n=1 Tax=Hwangdonia sp. TaxID=1883432 RepID=UPI003AB3FD6C